MLPDAGDAVVQPVLALVPGPGGDAVALDPADRFQRAHERGQGNVGAGVLACVGERGDVRRFGHDHDLCEQVAALFVFSVVAGWLEVVVVREQEPRGAIGADGVAHHPVPHRIRRAVGRVVEQDRTDAFDGADADNEPVDVVAERVTGLGVEEHQRLVVGDRVEEQARQAS